MHLEKGGNMLLAALNAANEITNEAFRSEEQIPFLAIGEINEQVMHATEFVKSPKIEDYIQTNELARQKASELVKNYPS